MSGVRETPRDGGGRIGQNPRMADVPDAFLSPSAAPGEPAPEASGSAEAVLRAMLERLYGALTRGPGINCRPHRSRQRVDLTDLDALGDARAADVLGRLLGEPAAAELKAMVPPPEGLGDGFRKRKKTKAKPEPVPEPQPPMDDGRRPTPVNLEARDPYREPRQELPAIDATEPEAEAEPEPLSPEDAWDAQRKLLTKLRALEDEARTYLHDTGVHALHLGYPLLSLPPGFAGGGKRILAPIAFTPIDLDAKAGVKPGVRLRAHAEDEDRLVVNPALLAWIERTLGERLDLAAAGVLPEEVGAEPADPPAPGADAVPVDAEPAMMPPVAEIVALVRAVADALGLEDDALAGWAGEEPAAAIEALGACPPTQKLPAGPAIVNAAVLGLFPAGNQGLLRDTREMIDGRAAGEEPAGSGLAEAFLSAGTSFDDLLDESADREAEDAKRSAVRGERFVTLADPSQGLAVQAARREPCLVLHGPPGTGKSQTIANVIGDHLARGKRVLFVCDKQTALDVVHNRLQALGLDGLCARVHDPQRDRRPLYMSVRETLANLADAKENPRSETKLLAVDDELVGIHEDLTALHAALMLAPEKGESGTQSFHTLAGRLLGSDAAELPGTLLRGTTEADLDPHRGAIDLVLGRAAGLGFASHPWLMANAADAAGGLDAHLSRPPAESGRLLGLAVEAAEALDAFDDVDAEDAKDPETAPPPFEPERPLAEQDAERARLLERLRWLRANPEPAAAAHAAVIDGDALLRVAGLLADARTEAAAVAAKPIDASVAAVLADDPPGPAAVAEQTGGLEQYLDTSGKWYAFALFGPKNVASEILRRYGKTLSPENAKAVRDALSGLATRRRLDSILEQVTGARPDRRLPGDTELLGLVERWTRLVEARTLVQGTPLRGPLRAALKEPAQLNTLVAGLERSPARSSKLAAAEQAMLATGVFGPTFRAERSAAMRTTPGGGAAGAIRPLLDRVDDLEDVLRLAEGLASLPEEIREALRPLLEAGAAAEPGFAALVRRCVAHEISRRLAAEPRLSRLDPAAIELAAERFAKLEEKKRGLVRDVILHRWTAAQRRRLLADSGGRLNSVGTAVRQRLFVTGKRAMRLRQVLRLGRTLGRQELAEREQQPALEVERPAVEPAIDPLMDLRPVWLASPEAVAQCFPREAIFDVVVFDEASQLRLEEALPVLTRAKRAVIAGDPQQLPPTRFFEAAFDEGDDAGADIDSEDDLFEAQQRGTEDLLSAALNLDAASTYLDVHYRSEDPGLIAFSNEHFYRGRLQALPVPPAKLRGKGGPAVELSRRRRRVRQPHQRGRGRRRGAEGRGAAVAEEAAEHRRGLLQHGPARRDRRGAGGGGDGRRGLRREARGRAEPRARRPARGPVRQEPGERAGRRARPPDHLDDVRADGRRPLLPALRAAGHGRRRAAAQRAGDAGAGEDPRAHVGPGLGLPRPRAAAGRGRRHAVGLVAALRVPRAGGRADAGRGRARGGVGGGGAGAARACVGGGVAAGGGDRGAGRGGAAGSAGRRSPRQRGLPARRRGDGRRRDENGTRRLRPLRRRAGPGAVGPLPRRDPALARLEADAAVEPGGAAGDGAGACVADGRGLRPDPRTVGFNDQKRRRSADFRDPRTVNVASSSRPATRGGPLVREVSVDERRVRIASRSGWSVAIRLVGCDPAGERRDPAGRL